MTCGVNRVAGPGPRMAGATRVTTVVRPWFVRDAGPPASGVSPIFPMRRSHLPAWSRHSRWRRLIDGLRREVWIESRYCRVGATHQDMP